MNIVSRIPGIPVLAAMLAIVGCNDGNSDGTVQSSAVNSMPEVTTVALDGSTSFDLTKLRIALATLPMGTISAAEEEGLLYMREEEKLARDVYTALNQLWMHNTFTNISLSEQTHTEAVLVLLERYAIADPVGANGPGVFSDPALQGLYDMLVAQGSASLIDGLIVGAEIEEIDLIDIEVRIADVVGNQDIVFVYENLMKGSRNHLRAFVRALEAQNVVYQPQHLAQDDYDAIINSPMETGR